MTTTSDSARPHIQCPHCGRTVLLDEAIAHQLAAPMRAGWEAEMRQAIDADVRATYDRELETERSGRAELAERLKEREGEVTALRTEEAKLLRDRRKLEDEKDDLERQKERMRDEIRKQERADAELRAKQHTEEILGRAEADYQEQLRLSKDDYDTRARQLEDQLKRVNAQLEQAQRKSGTGLRQQEGVSRQDLFAEQLQQRFPDDQITVTAVGKRGPDVTQVVRIGHLDCGVILWECKRTATWNAEWSRKLAAEARDSEARFAVIVSEVLPSDIDGSGQVGSVWVSDYEHAWHLAAGLRQAIITVHRYVAANAARAGIAEKVYDYFATGGFEARYKTMEQAIDRLVMELDQDQRTSLQRWKRLEKITAEIRDQGLQGIVLDVIGLGGEIPPAARAEVQADSILELTG